MQVDEHIGVSRPFAEKGIGALSGRRPDAAPLPSCARTEHWLSAPARILLSMTKLTSGLANFIILVHKGPARYPQSLPAVTLKFLGRPPVFRVVRRSATGNWRADLR